MVDNPFRNKPTNLQQNVEDWGNCKFKPKKFGHAGEKRKKYFNSNDPFKKQKWNTFDKNKDFCKFNQVAMDAKASNATPWSTYKSEIVAKNQEENQMSLRANMESNDAKSVLRQRQINYRKSLMELKKEEPTEWEDFSEQGDALNNKHKIWKNDHGTSNEQSGKRIEFNRVSKSRFKKNLPSSGLKAEAKEFISKELLNNFDSKNLSYEQNDKLRSVITRTSIMAFGESLEDVVTDMKKKRSKKEKFNKK